MHLDQVSTQPWRSSSSSLPPLPHVAPSPLWTAAERPTGLAAVPPWISAFSKKGSICILGGCNEGQMKSLWKSTASELHTMEQVSVPLGIPSLICKTGLGIHPQHHSLKLPSCLVRGLTNRPAFLSPQRSDHVTSCPEPSMPRHAHKAPPLSRP